MQCMQRGKNYEQGCGAGCSSPEAYMSLLYARK